MNNRLNNYLIWGYSKNPCEWHFNDIVSWFYFEFI